MLTILPLAAKKEQTKDPTNLSPAMREQGNPLSRGMGYRKMRSTIMERCSQCIIN